MELNDKKNNNHKDNNNYNTNYNDKDDNNNKKTTMTRVSQLWDWIETWSFCKDIKGISLMMMMAIRRRTTRWRTTTRTTTMTRVSQLWD